MRRSGEPRHSVPCLLDTGHWIPQALAWLLVFLTFFLACSQTSLGQAPQIDSINPSQGPISGGTVVTITGTNFQGATLSVDKVAIAPQAVSATTIKFTSTPHDNGIASVKVSTTAGAAYGEFLYVPPRLQDLPPGYITTVAGIGYFAGFYRRATQADIQPQGSPAYDQQGNLYIPEPASNRVTRVRPDGIIEPFAGTGVASNFGGSLGDGGPATEATMSFPRGVTTDSSGNVYFTEAASRIRRVDARTGIITTIAGNGIPGFSGDGGPAVKARLNDATHITGDGKGTIFFIDLDDASDIVRIRKITPDGMISTIAGVGPPGFSGDGGPATQAQFNLIFGDNGSLALDSQGNLFIVDTGNQRIRRIDGGTGIITTVYGPASVYGPAFPKSVATDAAGNIYYYDNCRIFKMSPSGQILATYGNGRFNGFSDDGTAITEAFVDANSGLAIDPSGNIVYVDGWLRRVRRLNLKTGLLETLAGMGPGIIGENGPAIATTLQNANGDLAFLPSGELLVGDTGRVLVRKIDVQGDISTVGRGGNPDEGKGWQNLTGLEGVKTNAAGEIYVADTRNVYRIDTTLTVHLIAGRQGEYGFSGDGGPAIDALFCQPWDVARDSAGNLYIADTNNNRIRRVDAQTGIVTTVAGSGPVNGFEHGEQNGHGSFCGDGGPAIQACLNTPYGVAVDSAGNLFIADAGNNRIRRVDSSGTITTFAVNIYVTKLVFDNAGNLYGVTNNGVFRFDTTGASFRLGGLWAGFSGDGGPALLAKTLAFGQTTGIAIDAEGNIFFNDGGNLRVRAIRYGALLAMPAITRQPASSRVTAGQRAIFAVAATGFPAPSYQWKINGGDIQGATDAVYVIASAQYSDAGTYTVVITNMIGSATSDAAGLTVVAEPTPPSFAAAPASQTVKAGGTAIFTVLANGIVPLTYQWQVNTNGGSSWSNLSDVGNYVGTSTATLKVSGTIAGMNGYQYRCVATNAVGSATSSAATLTVMAAAAPLPSALFPQVAIGGNNMSDGIYSTVFTLLSTGGDPLSGNLILTSNDGTPLVARLSVGQTTTTGSSMTISIGPGQTIFVTATQADSSDNSIHTGWGRVVSSGGALYGVATFQLVSNDTLRSIAGVLSSTPVSQATIPVDDDVTLARYTGYAVANLGSGSITISVREVSADGKTATALTDIPLLPGQQRAAFFFQDSKASQEFKGSVVLSGQNGATFGVVALVLDQNLQTALPVISSTVSGSSSNTFGHIAIGGGYSTAFALLNTGSDLLTGRLVLTGQDGAPLRASITDGQTSATDSSFPVAIQPGGAQFITVNPVNITDSTKAGWANISSAGGILGGVATFRVIASDGTLKTIAGVLPSAPVSAATMPVDDDADAGRYTGYAIANPGTSSIVVKLEEVSADGSTTTVLSSVNLNSGQQVAHFFNEDPLAKPKFQGSAVMIGQNGAMFSVVGLVQNQGMFTAIPVVPNKAPGIN